MNILRRPRTHPVWQEFAKIKPELPPMTKFFAPIATSFPEFYKNITLLEDFSHQLDETEERQEKEAEDMALLKENQEPNWVFWERTRSTTVDVAYLRDKTLYPNETDEGRQQRLKDKARADELNAWFVRFRNKIVAGEAKELEESYEEQLKKLTSEEDQRALKRGFDKQMNDLPDKISRTLRLIANIEGVDYNEPTGEELPPIANKVELKNWYGVDFDIAERDKEHLLEWNKLFSKELYSVNLRLNPEHHVQRTKEWDDAHAKSAKEKTSNEVRHDLLLLFLSDVPDPSSPEERESEKYALDYVSEHTPNVKPTTYGQLLEAVQNIGEAGLEKWVTEIKYKQYEDDFILRREKHPNEALNVCLSSMEEFVELSWDNLAAIIAGYNNALSQMNFAVSKLEYRKRHWPIDYDEVRKEYPDLVEEVKYRVRNYYWNPDASIQSCVEDDHELAEVRRMAWCKLLNREYKPAPEPIPPVFARPRNYAFPSKNRSVEEEESML